MKELNKLRAKAGPLEKLHVSVVRRLLLARFASFSGGALLLVGAMTLRLLIQSCVGEVCLNMAPRDGRPFPIPGDDFVEGTEAVLGTPICREFRDSRRPGLPLEAPSACVTVQASKAPVRHLNTGGDRLYFFNFVGRNDRLTISFSKDSAYLGFGFTAFEIRAVPADPFGALSFRISVTFLNYIKNQKTTVSTPGFGNGYQQNGDYWYFNATRTGEIIDSITITPISGAFPVDGVIGFSGTLNAALCQPKGPCETASDRGYEIASIKADASKHHTQFFTLNGAKDLLIIRRGEPFEMGLTMSEGKCPIDSTAKGFKLYATDILANVNIPIPEASQPSGTQWRYVWISTDPPRLRIDVPVSAPIGRYSLTVQNSAGRRGTAQRELLILFNPWNPEDSTFSQSATVADYIEQTRSTIWVKNRRGRINTISWDLGQFQREALETLLLGLSRIVDRADALSVANGLTRFVGDKVIRHASECDSSPNPWGNHSGTIFSDFLKNGENSGAVVHRCGQCHEQSAALVSLLRCAGLPARTLTCYNSGVDEDLSQGVTSWPENGLIDRFWFNGFLVDYETTSAPGLRSEHWWNYHSWAEALPVGDLAVSSPGRFWTICDPTFGIVTPVVYVYPILDASESDARFMAAAVDASVRDYMYTGKDPAGVHQYTLLAARPNSDRIVGWNLSAGNGVFGAETARYKVPETGVMPTSSGRAGVAGLAGNGPAMGELDIGILVPDEVDLGVSIEVGVRITNPTDIARTCRVVIEAVGLTHDAREIGSVVLHEGDVVVPSRETITKGGFIGESDYLAWTEAPSTVEFRIWVECSETSQVVATTPRVIVVEPAVGVSIEEGRLISTDQGLTVSATFQNPLSVDLTDAKMVLHAGQGSLPEAHLFTVGTIRPGQAVTVATNLVAPSGGRPRGEYIVNATLLTAEWSPFTGQALYEASPGTRLVVSLAPTGMLVIEFGSALNISYRLEYTESLVAPEWVAEEVPIKGTGGTVRAERTVGERSRLYRIRPD